jgi:hypothetical protein
MYEWGNPTTGASDLAPPPDVCEADAADAAVCEANNAVCDADNAVCEADIEESASEEEPVDYTPVVPPNFQAREISIDNDLPLVLDPHPVVPPRNLSGFFPSRYQNRRTGGKMVSRGERLCNDTIQRIYGVPFMNVRPAWLKNPESGERLELDCYNPDLQLAIEYNGIQHYVWPNFTGQSKKDFLKQVQRDRLKVELCDRNRVYLIVVPYIVEHDKIPEYIISYLPETIQQRINEEDLLSNLSDRIS